MPEDYTNLINLDEIPVKGNIAVPFNDLSILLCRVGEEVYAVQNECTHAFSKLEGGRQKGHYLFCPLHGVRFNLKDGCPQGNLTKKPLKTYPVKIKNGKIGVKIEKS
mgnify:CR=1 FL=1